MYETILHCPECGAEYPLVAEDVVAERDMLAAALKDAVERLTKLQAKARKVESTFDDYDAADEQTEATIKDVRNFIAELRFEANQARLFLERHKEETQ